MRMVLISLLFASAALAQDTKAPDPCDAHVERFLALDLDFATFSELRLSAASPSRQLNQSLKAVVQAHHQLLEAYTRIAAARCGLVSVDAKVMLGRVDEALADKFVHLEPPPRLSPEQMEIFTRELQLKARPLRQRAREAFAAAVRDADTFKLDSELIRLARQQSRGPAAPPRRDGPPRDVK